MVELPGPIAHGAELGEEGALRVEHLHTMVVLVRHVDKTVE